MLSGPMAALVVRRSRTMRNTENTKTGIMHRLYFKDDQPVLWTISFQYTMNTIPILEPITETIQVKIRTLRILRETAERNCDLKWSDKNELIKKTFQDTVLDTSTQAK